jgi:hypothetical protein
VLLTREQPLLIRPGLSVRLGAFLLFTHVSALLVSVMTPLSWYYRLALGALVLASFILSVGTHLWRRFPFAIREARWSAEGEWTLTFVSGAQRPARLLPRCYVHPLLVILSFRVGRWRFQHLMLTPDTLDSTLLRRLRVSLRSSS